MVIDKNEINVKRRICLFAGYDKNGKIYDYVIYYLKQLSEYCDIFYLADCDMKAEQLDRIKPYVKNAWAKRHGKYDWGSYSELAQNYVGWEIIEKYDELIFANDSNYCIRDFKIVFDKMDNQICDFWGLLSIGKSSPWNIVSNVNKIRVIKSLNYPFHICSFFLVYNKKIIVDKDFRFFLNNVRKLDKKEIIREYEIKGTKFLINKGYKPKTFIENFYPVHPAYSKYGIQLLKRGYPLIKVIFISNNKYKNFMIRLENFINKLGVKFNINLIKEHNESLKKEIFQISESRNYVFINKKLIEFSYQIFNIDNKNRCFFRLKVLGMSIAKRKYSEQR